MHSSGVYFANPARSLRAGLVAVSLALAILGTAAFAAVQPVRGAEPEPLKAVIIVGPAGSQTSADLVDAESIAVLAESYGMDVRRVFHPHATWDNVMANIQGANLVYYAGHGYGWPSPYTGGMVEARQNGLGLNSFDGSNSNTYTYYGASVLRANWVLAPNAIVFLNHDCYTAGNGEPGAAVPTWDVARQRVDNFASGFLAVGARVVYAYSYQKFNKTLTQLLTTNQTVEEIFRIPGQKPLPYWGWIGTDPRYFNSVRTPGARNYMDPHGVQGFLRAVTGDLSMTGADWKNGVGNGQAPELNGLNASAPGVNGFGPVETPFFTPNGDGVTDSMDLTFSVDREAFVDMTVKNSANDVVRTLSAWSRGGSGKVAWNGKNSAGQYVADGTYTVTATPHNRFGTEGNTESVDVNVFTVMRSPNVTPSMVHASDGDNFARTSTLAVTLQQPATFWWKVADKNGNVVRTFVSGASTAAGPQSVQWDGKDNSGAFVADGTYYSVTTTETSAGSYFHSMPVYVGAFRVTPVTTPLVRGTKVKFFVYSAETLSAKPKLKVFFPGLLPKTLSTTPIAGGGGWFVTVTLPATAGAGQVQMRPQGTDTGAQFQYTDFYFPLQ